MPNHITPPPEAPIFKEGVQSDRRVKVLRQYEILDTDPESAFDRLTDLAAEAFDVEISFVAFLDTDRQWFESTVGLSRRETDLAGTFCTQTIEHGDVLVIRDAAEDERTTGSPLETEAGLRFYAGVPLRAPCGTSIGTLSIMDPEPSGLSGQERERLRALAQMAMEELERRREARRSERVARRFEAVLEDPNMLAGVLAPGGQLLEANETAVGYIEEAEEEVVGELFWETPWWPEEMSSRIKENVARAAEGEYVEYEADLTDAEGRPYSVEGAIRPVGGEGQETEALVVSARDVTERKRREEELRRALRQYRAVFEDPGMLVGLLDPEGTVLDINQTALTHVDRSLDEVKGERLWKTPWFEGDPALQEDVRKWMRAAAKGEYVEFEADLTEAVGKRLVVEGAVRPVTDEEGNVTSLLISDRDVTEQRKQQNELRRKKSLLEQTQRMTGAWEADLPTGEVNWSDKVYEIHEMEPGSEIDLEKGLRFYAPESRNKLKQATEALVEEGRPYDLELQIITAEDNRRWVRTVGAPVEKKEGEPTKVAGAVQDITDRKEEERRRKQVIRRGTDAIVEVDAEWGFTFINETALECHDMSEEELLGKSLWEVLSETRGTEFEEKFRKTMRSREPTQFEACYPDLDRWFDVQVYPNEDGGLAFYFEDISERKQREQRLKALFENSPDMIHVHNQEGTVLRANPRFLEKTGYGEGSMGELKVWELDETSGVERARRMWAEMETGDRRRFEGRYRRKGGSSFPVEIHLRRLRLEGEDRFMAISHDITERKKRERELSQADTLFQNAQDALFLVDVERTEDDLTFRVQRVNPAYEEATGLSSEEVEGHLPRDIVGKEQGGWIEKKYRECIRRQEPLEYEEELPISGTTYWQTRIAPVVVEGAVEKIVGSTRDVTEQRRRKERLERQNDLFERAQQIADVGAWEYDLQSETFTLTDQARCVLGFDPGSELSLDQSYEHCPPEDRREAKESFWQCVDTGEPYDIGVRIFTEENGVRWIRCRGEPQSGSASGEVTRLRGTLQDITKQKEREEALRERQEKVRTLFEATRRLLTAESRETVAERIHDLLKGILDYPFVHVGLSGEDDIVPQKTAAEGLSREPETEPQPASEDLIVTRALRAQEAVVVEDAETLDNDVDYGSVTSLAGIPIGKHGAVVVGTEQVEEFNQFDLYLVEVMARCAALVLERLGREEALREAKEEAEEAARLRTAVLANMSHEIRTPLTPVIGFAESLAEELSGPEAQVAERIKRASQRLQQTLDSVLRLAQLEAGTFDLDREEIDLQAVILEVCNRICTTAEEKGLTLETHLPSRPVWGHFSEGGVRRIVENLLENAVKFTPKGGQVGVCLREANGTAVLEVEDTGIGICEEAQAEIFEAFEQESEGFGREYEGTGLGLSVVRRLAEAHGGTVNLESEKGVGSRFTVRLPVTQ